LAIGGSLPRSRVSRDPLLRDPLKAEAARRLATYHDAWVDDARLVALNAVDAAERGAEIATRTEFLSAVRSNGLWEAQLSGSRRSSAKTIVNAAGPWVADVLGGRLHSNGRAATRLIKGSHIVVPRLYQGEQAYILQQPDGRVVFALPYGDLNLVGTTDIAVEAPEEAVITEAETRYLCDAVNLYFRKRVEPEDVVWSYSGVRSLHDDGAEQAQAVTRDYHLEISGEAGPKLLSVFGGKITTARALAEEALNRLGVEGRKVTSGAPLPGGDILPSFNQYLRELEGRLPDALLRRLSRGYGTRMRDFVGDGKQLGRHFGAGLYEAEVRYLIEREFARTAEDILWRRTKLGLQMTKAEQKRLADYLR